MSDTPPALEDTQTTGPTDQVASRSAGLLGLIARLLDYGRALLEDLGQRNTQEVPPTIAYQFGAVSLSLIIARITRGIMLATALHERITRSASRLDAADRPAPATVGSRSERPRRAAGPEHPKREPVDEIADLHNLPSAKEIADRIRNRPIGAVIEEICLDLGVNGDHELWRDVLRAITFNGGRLARLVQTISRRSFDAAEHGVEPPPSPPEVDRVLAMVWNEEHGWNDEIAWPEPREWAIPPPPA